MHMPTTSAARRVLIAPIAIGALFLLMLCTAQARAAGTTSCRASAARVSLLGKVTVEPITANAGSAPCSTQSSDVLKPTTIGPVTAEAVQADTADTGTIRAGVATITHPQIKLGPIAIGAQALQASAQVKCSGTTPVLSSSSRVVGLQIAGKGITLPGNDKPFTLNLGAGGKIAVNETIIANGTITRRALDIHLPILGDVVVGEASAAADSASCTNTVRHRICPTGSVYDAGSGFCIIPAHNGIKVIIVGRPRQGPSGGRVIALPDARAKYKSPCLRGKGLPYAVVGTSKADRITGTNRSDRILLLAGNDRGDGGRGNDCIDGGSGRDRVSGALGRDRMWGDSGRDRMLGGGDGDHLVAGAGNDRVQGDSGSDRVSAGAGNDRVVGNTGTDRMAGGAGSDRLLGGPGNDRIHGNAGADLLSAGYGRDSLWGGSGHDLLVATILGPAARMIDGGPGRDTARFNPRERRHVRNVEHRVVIR
jgi:Ca2+-binding RTX toxin-like protein